MKPIALFLSLIVLSSCSTPKSPVDYVEPRIGTANSVTAAAGMFGKGTEELGQTLPAVLMPNGMNFWTPQTRDTEQKCISPYYFTDSLFQGFRNSHWITGGCTQDYGSMTLTALSENLRTLPESRATLMDKNSEKSRPDYYSVYLPAENMLAEMTATSRAALFRFTFQNGDEGFIVVNPNSDEGEGYVEIDLENRRITGYNPVHRIYQGWGEPAGFSGWFVVEWEQDLDVTGYGVYHNEEVYENEDRIGNTTGIGAYITFPVKSESVVMVKAASSFTSLEGALANLKAEIPGFDFEKTRTDLNAAWEKQLGKIRIESDDKEKLTNFYSALYRSSFLPRTMNDIDGSYPSFASGNPVRKMEKGKRYYDDFSMWDTYRALHPLLNIISPEESGDMMNSLVLKYEQGGWLPIFPCWNSYTSAMIGDHCTVVLADAYIKGIDGFDIVKAYEGMRKNAFEIPDREEYVNGKGRRALDSYLKYGYIPVEDSVPDAFHKKEQVSRTLEYAFDDFALSQVSLKLGKEEDYRILKERAGNWKNVINPATGYAAPRDSSGNFLPSDPFSFSKNITEGAPCHYTWYVPHDQEGLKEVMGGPEMYYARLDSMFTQKRYWHGNEPCHQIAWLFPYAGHPEKTADYVAHIMETEYLPEPGGLSGNDDAGQMSAWYIFAALGFYPVAPATPDYILGLPTFPKAEIELENGNKFTILNKRYGKPDSPNDEPEILLNGKRLCDFKISHSDIIKGGTLVFQ
ncbi:MAG: GH92 family glycosyl hydrolase [Muribaculaceae bacterium]|nr:GH92 family glycosyl hydrolase [Muribaculaceae bacterium]